VADLVAPRTAIVPGMVPSARARLILGVAGLVAVGFVAAFVWPYASLDPARYGPFWTRRHFLLAHLVPGTAALLLAPVLLWLGLTRSRMAWHRRLGQVYLAAVAASSAAAVGLAVTNPVSVVYGLGLIGLTTAWLATTAMAWFAVRRRDLAQHRDWMIRSAVVTFAFVWFRLVLGAGMALRLGTESERFILAEWSCWSVPLLVTEVLLQAGRVRRLPPAPRG
jgi:hypothetical protein